MGRAIQHNRYASLERCSGCGAGPRYCGCLASDVTITFSPDPTGQRIGPGSWLGVTCSGFTVLPGDILTHEVNDGASAVAVNGIASLDSGGNAVFPLGFDQVAGVINWAGHPNFGIADAAAVHLFLVWLHTSPTVVVETLDFTGAFWDASSNLWALIGEGVVGGGGILTDIFNSVNHTYVNSP